MGRHRKIPARKHHGIRDPLKKLAEKEHKLRNLVNNPPSADNDQPETHKFVEFKRWADRAQAGKRIRIHHSIEDRPVELIKPKSYRRIVRYPEEDDASYLRRVNRITNESLREAAYSAKYGVDVVRDTITGVITIHKRPKNEIDELLKEKKLKKRMRKAFKKEKKHLKTAERMDRQTAKELIKQAIKEDDEDEEIDVVEYKEDPVAFGELVHAPPQFLTLPKKAKANETVSRPGAKNNLLLKQWYTPGEVFEKEPKAVKKLKTSTVTKEQLSGKMKNLPIATRAMLENERDKVMEIYRQNKAKKADNAQK